MSFPACCLHCEPAGALSFRASSRASRREEVVWHHNVPREVR
jgi:hypothetical protein